MAFPELAETITVKGQYLGPDGDPARGYILVTLDQSLADKDTNTIYTRKPLRYDLDGNGAVEFDIIKTGATDADPVPLTRNVAVTITENFEGVKKYTWKTVFDTSANDETDIFQLADAAEVTQRPLNQYVLLGTYAADLNAKASLTYVNATFAPKANPTFTGTVTGVTKTHVGLGNVDNTSDVNKPVSTAQATAIGLKANSASPTFTGTIVVDTTNFSTDTTTGTKIGTATTQKLGFFNATPVVQQTATTDLGTALSNLGLRAAGTAYPISTTGVVQINGPLRRTTQSVTSATTLSITTGGSIVLASNAGASYAITLPATTTAGYNFIIKKTDANTNPITIAGVDGVTKTLDAQYEYIEVITTATSGVFYQIGGNV